MNLLDSLLDAIVRLEGDALVMHVGEKPYVVTTTSAMNEFRGPLLWGQVDLSSRVLTSEAVLGLLEQILPPDQRQALANFGAVEHQIDSQERNARFSVIAARAGDDVWLEVRKRPKEAPVVVEQPVAVDEPVTAEEPIAVPDEVPVVEPPIEPSAELPVVASIEIPIQEVIPVVHTVEAIEQPGVIQPAVAVTSHQIEPAVSLEQPAAADTEQDETPEAPFEIVHEVNQDAPTDADVDALLAESAAALLRSAAPRVDREPLDLDRGAWQELESDPALVLFDVESESVSRIPTEPPVVAEVAQAVVPEPMRLASETESIALASELERVAIAPEPEYVPLIAEIERDAELPESMALEAVAMDPELDSVLVGAEAEDEPVEFVEEFELEEHFRFDAAFTAFVPETASIPELELVLVGAAAGYEPVAFAEDFRLVAPTADTFAPTLLAMEPEPEPDPVTAIAQPELFAFIEDIRVAEDYGLAPAVLGSGQAEATASVLEPAAMPPQPVLVIAESELEPSAFVETTELVAHAIAAAPEPEPAKMVAVPEPPPVYIEPALVAAATESNKSREVRQPVATASAYTSDHQSAVHIQREEPAKASASSREPEVHPERSVVVPLTSRSIREGSASPTTADPAPEFSIEELLRAAAARGASTVYVVAQSRPMVRADGDINVLDIGTAAPLDARDIARLMNFAPESVREAWQRGASAEWISDVADVGRVRCTTFRDHRGPGLIFRMIPAQAISADHLGLTQEVQALCAQSDGLVLVTGPRAGGKSTLMTGFVDLINRTRGDHVITIESQIEFVHESRRSFVSQREIQAGDAAVVSAVRSALREDPDVLFIGDLSSADVVAVALEAAESGRLVFASLPAASTVAAVDRLLALLPADRTDARASLAGSLRGVVAEVLVGRARGGRVAAREVLLNTAAVAGLIQDAKTDQLPLAMENGRRHGMMPLNDVLTTLVREGTVHVAEAYRKAFDKESLLAALRQEGVDTSFAEKIA